MDRLVYDGSVNQGDTTLYIFISRDLEQKIKVLKGPNDRRTVWIPFIVE